jgi:uncharacterized membrane protein HdeD (DUF308 family)
VARDYHVTERLFREMRSGGWTMSSDLDRPFGAGLRHGIEALRGNWFWFVLVGIALVALGFFAVGSAFVASLATAVAIGVLLFMGGVTESVGAFWAREWSGFFLHFLSGLLSIVIGVLFIRAPLNALLALTLLVASFLLVGGVFKIVAALNFRFAAWGWPLLSGVIDVVLGLMIWSEWPASALWVIGLFVGINMIFRGANWIALGLAFRSLPRLRNA